MSATTSAPAGRFDRRLLAPMVLGSILNPINSSIIAVALVPIAVSLGAPASSTAWLVTSLYLATAIGQPVTGRLVDVLGPRPLFLVGAVLTGAAGLLGALAPSLGVLVVARMVLGLGTCAGYPASMSLIRSEARRTGLDSPAGVLTVLAVATQTTAVVGPTVGGLLIGLGGWRATFAVNVPLSVAALALGAVVLPRVRPAAGDRPGARLDLTGIGGFAAALVSLLLFLTGPSPARAWLLVVAAVAGAGFAARELRAGDPFIDLRVFAGNRPLLATYARSLLAATVSYSFLYGFTQWMEDGRRLSASVAGLVLLPAFAVGIVVSTTTGRSPQLRGKLLVGAAAQVVACAGLLVVGSGSSVWLLVAVSLVLGLPQGLLNLANQNALYRQAGTARLGASAGLLRTFFYLGAIIASAVTGAAFGARASTRGLHELALVMLGSAAANVVLTLADRSLARPAAPAA